MSWRVAVAALTLVVVACASPTVTNPSPTPIAPPATPQSTPAPTTGITPEATQQGTPRAAPTPSSDSGEVAHPPACGDAVLEFVRDHLLLITCVNQLNPSQSEHIWAFTGAGWSLVSDDGPPPVVVTGAAYDSERGAVVRYGGLPMNSNDCVPETWEWDGAAWEQPPVLEDPDPPACDHMKLAFDPGSERVLMVGGGDDAGNLTMETWAWDGIDWSRAAEVGPVGRAHHGLVSDPGHSSVFLYGGYDGANVFDDFWEWDGTDWSELDITGPGPRSHFGLAISDQAEMLLFGGATGPRSFETMVADTWLVTGGSWQALEVGGPSARLSPALGFERSLGLFVLYGGFGPDGEELGDTWQFDGSTWECVEECET